MIAFQSFCPLCILKDNLCPVSEEAVCGIRNALKWIVQISPARISRLRICMPTAMAITSFMRSPGI